MAITFDPARRNKTLADRDLDFTDAAAVFDGPILQFEDERSDYAETRMVAVGHLYERMVIVIWTPRGADRHVFSMKGQ